MAGRIPDHLRAGGEPWRRHCRLFDIGQSPRRGAARNSARAFDARTGRPRWSFDPLVHDGISAGHANVWAPMSADEDRGLVFLPTSSPSPDFWGGKRPGNNEHADSVVGLRAQTGELVWSFQAVHHDVWDYDLPAQPTLARIDTGAGQRDIVIQPTKQGFVFVLDRDSGKPIWPVEERGVPQGGAEGEQLSPTQPFPTHVPALMPQRFSTADIFNPIPTFGSRSVCEEKLQGLRNEGLYTPPSTQGTLEFPFTGGGVNWGGAAFDPVNQVLYANTSYAVHIIKLIPRTEADGFTLPPGYELGPQRGAPFAMTRAVALSSLGLLCNKPPWGAMDAYLRAFDAKSGEELWQSRLPVPGIANPMTYLWKGEQYVVIASGGHSESGTSIGDSIVAFRLARQGETPSLWSRTIDRPGGRFLSGAIAFALACVLAAAALWRWRRQVKLRRAARFGMVR